MTAKKSLVALMNETATITGLAQTVAAAQAAAPEPKKANKPGVYRAIDLDVETFGLIGQAVIGGMSVLVSYVWDRYSERESAKVVAFLPENGLAVTRKNGLTEQVIWTLRSLQLAKAVVTLSDTGKTERRKRRLEQIEIAKEVATADRKSFAETYTSLFGEWNKS